MAVKISVYGEANLKQIAAAQKELDKLKSSATKNATGFKGAMGKMSASVTGLLNNTQAMAGVAIVAGAAIMKSVQAYAEAEAVQNRLARAVANAGQSYTKYGGVLDKTIKAQSRLAAVDDEEVAESMTRLIQATGDVNKAMRLNQIALDLSRAKGKALGSTTQVLAKVYNGNVGALKKFGVAVKDGATAVEALGELEKKYAGYAEDYGNSTAGAADRMSVSWGNFMEAAGEFAVNGMGVPQTLDTWGKALDGLSEGDWGKVLDTFIETDAELIQDQKDLAAAAADAAKATRDNSLAVQGNTTANKDNSDSIDSVNEARWASEDASINAARAQNRLKDAEEALRKKHISTKEALKGTSDEALDYREALLAVKRAQERLSKENIDKIRQAWDRAATAVSRYKDRTRRVTGDIGRFKKAAGDIVPATPGGVDVTVAEAGSAEAIIPINNRQRSYDLLAATMSRMGVGVSPGAVVVNVSSPNASAAQIAAAVEEALKRIVRTSSALGRV